MKFDEIYLNKTEIKMLKCFRYNKANVWELHGYFNFPGIEYILSSLQTLLNNNFIYEEGIRDPDFYLITSDGEKYLTYLARKKRTNIGKALSTIILTLAGLVAIAEFVLPALLN